MTAPAHCQTLTEEKSFLSFHGQKMKGSFTLFVGAPPLSQGSLPVSQTRHSGKGSKVQSEFGTGHLDRVHAGKARKGGWEGTISNMAGR